MIVTLTPNPSIDRAVLIEALRRGEVHRATGSRIDPGGKGVNVSRALAAQGADTVAVLPSGGPEGHLLDELLDSAGVAHESVPVSGTVRMNISVLEPDGTTTKLNEPGPTLSEAEVAMLLDTTLERSTAAGWVVGCGSLPPGAPTELYAVLVRRVRERGGRVAIDSSGASFAAAVAATPHLIKPNHEELAELVGHDLPTPPVSSSPPASRSSRSASAATEPSSSPTTSARTPSRRSRHPSRPWAPATACSQGCSTGCRPVTSRPTPSSPV